MDELLLLREFYARWRMHQSVLADADIDFDATMETEIALVDAAENLDNFYRERG